MHVHGRNTPQHIHLLCSYAHPACHTSLYERIFLWPSSPPPPFSLLPCPWHACGCSDTGSLSSPVALQHYLPANIEKELLTLNAAVQDAFQVCTQSLVVLLRSHSFSEYQNTGLDSVILMN